MADALDRPAALIDIDGPIATITFNRPERMNAVNLVVHAELRAIMRMIDQLERPLGALVITGSGRAFCAGQDLHEREAMLVAGSVDLGASLEENYNPLIRWIGELPCPVIAAVNGVAAGAGAAIALACDIVLAGESARFQFAFAKVALGPDCGTSYFLPRLVGSARAMALALTAEPLPALTAAEWGLIWRCVPDQALLEDARALARSFAEAPRAAIASIKASMRAGAGLSLGACLDSERDAQRALGNRQDYRDAVASFAARRARDS